MNLLGKPIEFHYSCVILSKLSILFPPQFVLLLAYILLGFPGGSDGKESPAMQEAGFNPWVRKIPLEKGKAAHVSSVAWRIPRTEEPDGHQHTRLPCSSLSPRVCLNSCPLSRWCHPTIQPLSPPSALGLSLSQHQGLFQWTNNLFPFLAWVSLYNWTSSRMDPS